MSFESPWELLLQGKFDEACQSADQAYESTGSLLHLRNKVFALLNLSRYADAVAVASQVIDSTDGESDSDFILMGVGQWLQGCRTEAMATWLKGCSAKFTDAAGGVEIPLLLGFAASRLADVELKAEANRLIMPICDSNRSRNWPGPLGLFVMGKINEEKLLDMVSVRHIIKEKQLCQASFYIGLRAQDRGDEVKWHQSFTECIKWGRQVITKQEYYLAKGELGISGPGL